MFQLIKLRSLCCTSSFFLDSSGALLFDLLFGFCPILGACHSTKQFIYLVHSGKFHQLYQYLRSFRRATKTNPKLFPKIADKKHRNLIFVLFFFSSFAFVIFSLCSSLCVTLTYGRRVSCVVFSKFHSHNECRALTHTHTATHFAAIGRGYLCVKFKWPK